MSQRHQARAPHTRIGAMLAAAAIFLAVYGSVTAPLSLAATPAAAPTPTAAPAPAPIPLNKPVAIVAGQPISGAAYADLVAQERAGASIQAQQQGAAPPTERQIRTQALNTIITTAVINHYAAQHGITATAQEVQRQYNAAKQQIEQQARQASQKITFEQVLKRFGYTTASFKQALANGIIGNKVEQKLAPAGLIDAVRARHILIGPPPAQTATGTPTATKAKPDSYYKAKAESIYQQLVKNPGRFAALAHQESIDTGSGAQGGELGWFVKGMMVPPFEQAAFSQPVGQIGKPVKSQFGYHIIQVEEHKRIPFTRLPQAAGQVPAVQALAQKQQKQFTTWLSGERSRDHVRILYKV